MRGTTRHVNYGKQHLPLLLPGQAQTLEVREPLKIITPDLFRERLQVHLNSHPLDLSQTIIVVADKTRLCGYPDYLPVLADVLGQNNLNQENLKFIIAYGTHSRQSDAECIEAYGEIYNEYEFIHHDCQDTENFVELGLTSSNTPIRYRKDLLKASSVITMGAVCHHYFAGYGGGRKLLFPGCGEKKAIYKNHGLYLNRHKQQLETACQPGVLDKNPLADDLFEVEKHLPASLSIHGILNSSGQLCDLLLGRTKQDFLHACDMHGSNCETTADAFDLVIASSGGFPKDINFIQSHKAVHNGAMFVRDGGLLLIYCECREKIGSKTFLPWFRFASFDAAFTQLAQNYEGNGGTALAMMTKLQRIQIGLVTELNPETCAIIGVEKWSHKQVQQHLSKQSSDAALAFIPNSSLLVRASKNKPTAI